jgi:hypothetical protein
MQSISLDGLSPAQVQVAAALAAGASISKAAALTNTGRTTIYTWLKTIPQFADTVRRATCERSEILRDKLYDQTIEAVDTISAIMHDETSPHSVRLRAALAILNRDWNLPTLPLPDQNGTIRNTPEQETRTPEPPPAEAAEQNGTVRNTSEQKSRSSLPPVARNAPCPCGSREKFKRCCGRGAPPVLSKAAA